jgi:hypothetical protein
LAKSLEQKKVILVQAPPYSGKTSLAQLLENHLVVNSLKLLRVIRISLLWGLVVGKKCEYDTFGKVWKRIVGVEWHKWVEQCEKIPSILIIDEAQMIYRDKNNANESMKNTGTAVEFWDTIKLCLQGSMNLNVIMFAAYGYDTSSAGLSIPVYIPSKNSIGFKEIKFTYKELEAYTNDYCNKNFGLSSDSCITLQFISYINNATFGHVGLVRHLLHHTKNAMQNEIHNQKLTWRSIFTYLNSDVFSRTIDDCRATPKLSNLSDEQIKKCQEVYFKGKIKFSESDDINKYLIESGLSVVVIDNEKYLCFAAPLIEQSFFQQYYGKEICAESTPNSLYEFIVKIFTIMCKKNRGILSDALESISLRFLEKLWQKEFYKIGNQVLGNDYYLSFLSESEEYTDFYIDGLDWAIELLKEGLDMEEYNRRIDETTGEYKEIMKVANEMAIIDIRCESKKVRKLKKGFVHVSMSENYDSYIIECLGEKTVILKEGS